MLARLEFKLEQLVGSFSASSMVNILYQAFNDIIGINPSGLLPEENAHLNNDDSY